MKLLFCCNHYLPSLSGVSKVVKEIAERFSKEGHDVHVATSMEHYAESKICISGVSVQRFSLSGSRVTGLKGDLQSYQEFVVQGGFDVVFIYAAEQWSFDGLWDVLDQIKGRLIHVPCGYASFSLPAYRKYYHKMPAILKKFHALIFHAEDYQDINFVKKHVEGNVIHIVPNAASMEEFGKPPSIDIRHELGIENEFVFLTVGFPGHLKGQLEIVQAYCQLQIPKSSVLILNGHFDFSLSLRNIAKYLLGRSDWKIKNEAKAINSKLKRIIWTDLPRERLVSLFFHSDLYLMASHVEYSPLVLFESMASGLPFLATPVGNCTEILRWSNGGGALCDDVVRVKDSLFVDPASYAEKMKIMASDVDSLKEMGKRARKSWEDGFTWEKIYRHYREIFYKDLTKSNSTS